MFIGATYVQAQDYASHNWYFGNNNLGIRFNRSDNAPSLVVNNATSTPGGAAVATNSVNGNLLFYSDGQNIYDASHQVMFGATPLGGNPNGNQAVAIAKVPGEANQYYVFVNTADGTTPGAVNYFTVDMSRTGNATFPSPPLGEMIASNGAVPGVAGVSEAMITVPSAGDDFFLITHANGSPDFFVTRLHHRYRELGSSKWPATLHGMEPPGQPAGSLFPPRKYHATSRLSFLTTSRVN